MIIRAIKVYFAAKKQKKRLQKYINHEILEVLTSICLYLETEGRRTVNPRSRVFGMHAQTLKEFSDLLRKEIIAEEEQRKQKEGAENDT